MRHHAAVDIPDVHPQPKDLPFLQTLDAFAFQVTHFLDLRMPVTEKMKRWIVAYGIDIDAVRRELAYSPFRRDQYVALSHLGYEKAIQVLDSEDPILSSPPDFIREESFICNLETSASQF